ncbi:MAG: SLC13 family permease [Thermomicrobiales bacterium]|nr:SLC13 family permease [Thermomicrobiales bacterium]
MDQVVSLVGLVAIFGLAFWRNLNMGAVALAFSYLFGVFYFDLDAKAISAGFPGNLVITLLGVTYIFGIGRVNGTVDQIVRTMVRGVHGRVVLIPWVFFLLAAGISASGALTIATYGILVPIGMALAQKHRINPVLMGLSIINGANAGGFSPVAVYYTIIQGTLNQWELDAAPIPVFIWTFVGSLVVNIIAFLIFGGMKLIRTSKERNVTPIEADLVAEPKWTRVQYATVAIFLSIVIGALIFDLDVGFLAMIGAVFIAAFTPEDAKAGLQQIGWGVVLLIGGIVTYVNMLDSTGTITDLAHQVAGVGTPMLAALLLLYIAAIVSAFASTNAMFVILVPLAVPLLQSGDVAVLGFTIALALSAVVVDTSPFSTAGALVVANTDEHRSDRVFRGLLWWAAAMMVLAPPATWAAFVIWM